VTDDAFIAGQIRLLRNYGQTKKYHHVRIGHNKRLDTIQAAVLEVKLAHLEDWNGLRRRQAQRYKDLLKGVCIALPFNEPFAEHVWHLFVIECEERDSLAAHLHAYGIETGIHYPVPIHLQNAYRSVGYAKGDFPVSEGRAKRVLSLPIYPELTPQIQDRVVQGILDFQKRKMAAA
jgi:dTDP-4-amino-4,6-dideoxygalactose transaminase